MRRSQLEALGYKTIVSWPQAHYLTRRFLKDRYKDVQRGYDMPAYRFHQVLAIEPGAMFAFQPSFVLGGRALKKPVNKLLIVPKELARGD